MADTLFGTDGIRAVANRGPLTPPRVVRLGQVLGAWLAERLARAPRVLIIRDTRTSGPMLEGALAAGLASRGAAVGLGGVLPTPALELAVPRLGYDLGIVLSASHNPPRDNGIKLFGADGGKLADAVQADLEARLRGRGQRGRSPGGRGVGAIAPEAEAWPAHVRDLVASGAVAGAALAGMRVALDCAHGAAAVTAPEVFRRLGAEVVPLATEPDGARINHQVGALHPGKLQRLVKQAKAVVGFAFDGDGDRVIAVDERGAVRDGDALLYVLARDRLGTSGLPGKAVVGTVMTNLGLEVALGALGVTVERTPVGDRHVAARMRERQLALGAEASGHVIFHEGGRERGDATLTALEVLGSMIRRGRPLSVLCKGYKAFPQVQRQVRVQSRPPLESLPAVREALEAARVAVGARGRVVARYSGTEPVARIMLEGEDEDILEAHAGRLAWAILQAVGDRREQSKAGPT